jgi:SAM-dependent methyltransferase
MSAPWQFLCAFDTIKAGLPFQATLRRYKDHILGYQREPNREKSTIRDGLEAISWLGGCKGARIVEVGSGWQPLVPILLSIAGAHVYMTDLFRLLRIDTFNAALHAIREDQELISKTLPVSPDVIDHVTRDCSNLTERLEELRLEYLAPCDCRNLPLDSQSVDFVISRNVLEHIPPPIIEGIFLESRRVLKEDGRMWHLVDHSDHWSDRDQRISTVNFLQYPEWLFKLTCLNPQNYQNRLRHPEYVAMATSTGFVVEREQRKVDSSGLRALEHIPLTPRFKQFSPEDLATTSSTLLAAPR